MKRIIMKRIKYILASCVCLIACVAMGQFSIGWWKVAAGGGPSTGGVFTASATIGQHEAGTVTGGQFALTGGFWGAFAVQSPGAPTLVITPAGSGQATLTWSPQTPGFHLQTSDSLSPAAWINAPSGTNHPVTVPTTEPMKFYRLARP
jgi:hypothetical protein